MDVVILFFIEVLITTIMIIVDVDDTSCILGFIITIIGLILSFLTLHALNYRSLKKKGKRIKYSDSIKAIIYLTYQIMKMEMIGRFQTDSSVFLGFGFSILFHYMVVETGIRNMFMKIGFIAGMSIYLLVKIIVSENTKSSAVV